MADEDHEADEVIINFIRENPNIDNEIAAYLDNLNHEADQVIVDFVRDNPNIDNILSCYMNNFDRYICDDVNRGPVVERYNYQIQQIVVPRERLTTDIYQTQNFCFKINASCGCILQNNRTGEVRYFYSCWNNAAIFPEPFNITNRSEWNRFLEDLANVDYIEAAAARRENT